MEDPVLREFLFLRASASPREILFLDSNQTHLFLARQRVAEEGG
jgi:hypothetical protein